VALSGRNQLRGVVEEVRARASGPVRLRIGHQTLTAVITRDAIDELKLRRGDEALAVIKALKSWWPRNKEKGEEKREKGQKAAKVSPFLVPFPL
jgi:molybdopterin-binding protein